MNKAKVITALIALLAALGLGGYTIVKKTDLLKTRLEDNIYRVVQVLDGDTIRVSNKESGSRSITSLPDRLVTGNKETDKQVTSNKELVTSNKETDKQVTSNKELVTGNPPEADKLVTSSTERVRLLGINAPEEGECYAKEAGEYLKSLVGEKEVRLEKDVSGADQYGRLLRYVFIPSGDEKENDVFVNEMLVREGYAVYDAHPPDNRYREFLASAGEEARNAKRGIWGACNIAPTENERERATQREIDMPPPSPNCIIKGNISEKGYGKTYLVPGCDNYNNVKVDTRKGERYFCTEEEATSAGFRRADNCPL